MAYLDKRTQTYVYDFQLGGHRHYGDTQTANKRQAEAIEAAARATAKTAVAEAEEVSRQFKGGEMTFRVATDRWITNHGQHLAKHDELSKALLWIEGQLEHGGETLLSAIDNNEVTKLLATKKSQWAQKGHNRKRGTKPSGEPKKLRPATINRDLLSPLRQVIHMARDLWNVHTTAIAWNKHWQKENNEIVREAQPPEEAALMAALDRGYDDAVMFTFLTGCRLTEVVTLEWKMVNVFTGVISITGKGNKTRQVPMTPAIRELLDGLRGNHDTYVFTYEAARTREDHGTEKGKRYPIRRGGLVAQFQRAKKLSGVTDFRFHDIRHTKATRALRASGDLVRVQKLLGHSSITTTARYAHAVVEDVREAMEQSEDITMQIAREKSQKSPSKIATPTAKVLTIKRKSA